MTKYFEVKKADEIPPFKDKQLNISDWYFGKTLNVRNEESKSMCVYDFTKNKWIFNRSGQSKLIEYYI